MAILCITRGPRGFLSDESRPDKVESGCPQTQLAHPAAPAPQHWQAEGPNRAKCGLQSQRVPFVMHVYLTERKVFTLLNLHTLFSRSYTK